MSVVTTRICSPIIFNYLTSVPRYLRNDQIWHVRCFLPEPCSQLIRWWESSFAYAARLYMYVSRDGSRWACWHCLADVWSPPVRNEMQARCPVNLDLYWLIRFVDEGSGTQIYGWLPSAVTEEALRTAARRREASPPVRMTLCKSPLPHSIHAADHYTGQGEVDS